jgi:hypothetical protein
MPAAAAKLAIACMELRSSGIGNRGNPTVAEAMAAFRRLAVTKAMAREMRAFRANAGLQEADSEITGREKSRTPRVAKLLVFPPKRASLAFRAALILPARRGSPG